MHPSYLQHIRSGELARLLNSVPDLLRKCSLCPRDCRIDRSLGGYGYCTTGRYAHVASYTLHFGEEAPLVGSRGSGTIFFAGCNLGCLFCQNHDISRKGSQFPEADPFQLAGIMVELQERGAHNINLVTPSHVIPQILEALPYAVDKGLHIPLVYNSSGYDSVESLRLLHNIVDIYMPDVKWASPDTALDHANAADYPARAMAAVAEMHGQVGDLVLDGNGIARRGLLVRHLVLPAGLAGTSQWMRFLSRSISPDTYVNIMDQYIPCAEAGEHPQLNRPATAAEVDEAFAFARDAKLHRLDDPHQRSLRVLRRLFLR